MRSTNLINRVIMEQSTFALGGKALFIALVSFGGPAGVLLALFPRFFFGLAGPLVCPANAKLIVDTWNDGASNQLRTYCVNTLNQESSDRTLLALAVLLGLFFLFFLYSALIVLLVNRAIYRRKFGAD
jgi:hypothetical protein